MLEPAPVLWFLRTMAFADLPPSVQAEYERIGRERELASRQADRDQWFALLRAENSADAETDV